MYDEEQYDNTIDAALMKFAKTCKCTKCGIAIPADDYYCEDIDYDENDYYEEPVLTALADVFIECYECFHNMRFNVELELWGGTWRPCFENSKLFSLQSFFQIEG